MVKSLGVGKLTEMVPDTGVPTWKEVLMEGVTVLSVTAMLTTEGAGTEYKAAPGPDSA